MEEKKGVRLAESEAFRLLSNKTFNQKAGKEKRKETARGDRRSPPALQEKLRVGKKNGRKASLSAHFLNNFY